MAKKKNINTISIATRINRPDYIKFDEIRQKKGLNTNQFLKHIVKEYLDNLEVVQWIGKHQKKLKETQLVLD